MHIPKNRKCSDSLKIKIALNGPSYVKVSTTVVYELLHQYMDSGKL